MGDSYLQSLGQEVPILMNTMQPWCLAKVGPAQPGRDLKRGPWSSCMPLAPSHCCGLSAAVLSPPATGNQLPEMAKRWREMWWSGDDWCLLVPECPLCPLDRSSLLHRFCPQSGQRLETQVWHGGEQGEDTGGGKVRTPRKQVCPFGHPPIQHLLRVPSVPGTEATE